MFGYGTDKEQAKALAAFREQLDQDLKQLRTQTQKTLAQRTQNASLAKLVAQMAL